MRWLDPKTKKERDELILRLREQGLKIEQIAKQVNLSLNGTESVLYKMKKRRMEEKGDE